MIKKIVLPKSGMGIEEATLSRWLKAVGDAVTEGEPVAEMETAKAVEQIESPASGTLVKILVADGETVPVNTEIGVIEENDG